MHTTPWLLDLLGSPMPPSPTAGLPTSFIPSRSPPSHAGLPHRGRPQFHILPSLLALDSTTRCLEQLSVGRAHLPFSAGGSPIPPWIQLGKEGGDAQDHHRGGSGSSKAVSTLGRYSVDPPELVGGADHAGDGRWGYEEGIEGGLTVLSRGCAKTDSTSLLIRPRMRPPIRSSGSADPSIDSTQGRATGGPGAQGLGDLGRRGPAPPTRGGKGHRWPEINGVAHWRSDVSGGQEVYMRRGGGFFVGGWGKENR